MVRVAEALAPQLCTLVTEPPDGDAWLHEIKLDGYRVFALLADGRVRLVSRAGNDLTGRFAGVAEAVAALPATDVCLDGEVVVVDAGGVSDFASLIAGRGAPVLFAFDLLRLDGEDLRAAPLEARKERLRALVEGSRVKYTAHRVGDGPAFFEAACRHGLEGVVSKRRDAPYRAGRGADWRKVKCHARQELVVVGWTDPAGLRGHFGALLLAFHEGGELRYAGRVGTGFTEDALARIRARLRARPEPPVVNPPVARGLHWCEPDLVAEVRFAGWTDAGVLRQPSFLGLRDDKSPAEVVRE